MQSNESIFNYIFERICVCVCVCVCARACEVENTQTHTHTHFFYTSIERKKRKPKVKDCLKHTNLIPITRRLSTHQFSRNRAQLVIKREYNIFKSLSIDENDNPYNMSCL